MSLINDALKKAQRERAGQAGPLPTTSGGVGHRGMSTQTMILIGAAALVLVSVSVAFTVFLTSSPPPTPVKAAPLALSLQKMGTAPATANSAPTISFPNSDKAPSAPAVTVAASAPVQSNAETKSIQPRAAAIPISTKTTEQIQDMVDKFHVSGVRSSASGSKVLMNDHIVKLNDIVDRESGLKLVKIEDSSLTFIDASGAEYTKAF